MDSVSLQQAMGRQLEGLAFRGLPWDRLIHTLPIGIYSCDASGRLVQYNSQAALLWGRSPDLDRNDYFYCGGYKAYRLTGEPIDYSQGPIAQVLKTGKSMHAKEAILERPDGSRIFIQADTEPLFDDAGRLIGAVACFQDISERKQAEHQHKLLIDELNHRVKNSLATVQSLVVQTARNTDMPLEDYRQMLQSRVQALSRAHDQLSHRRWHDADFGEVVRGGLAPHLGRDNIELKGEAVTVPPRAALLLSMAMHELVTNAARHGALSRPGGRVELVWTVVDRKLAIDWREVGGPEVTPPTRTGFGLRLVERGIPAELRGTSSLDFAPTGLCCRIEVPLRHGDE